MSNTTTIYLVRHGQTEWNLSHKFQGHQDSPLTALGMQQARWLGEALRDEPLDIIYASSSPRARHTAELIRDARDVGIIESDDLKEIQLGIWEGRIQDEIQAAYPEQYQQFWQDPENFHVEGSETYHEVSERALGKLRDVIDNHEGRSILIVTHTVVVKLLMAYFEGRPMQEIWNPPYIHPACLCKIEIEGDQSKILLHGDTSHYREESVGSW